jgi:putative endonuclease
MANHNNVGKRGEDLAAQYLLENGFEILERNWRFEKKEIDIIALKGNLIAIVEVKTRSTAYFGRPEEFVTKAKQKFLVHAADAFAQHLDFEAEIRYDIIAIVLNGTQAEINHIEDAFIPLL